MASAGIEFKNDMDVIRVTMHEPTLDDTMPDLERLTWAVERCLRYRACKSTVYCNEKYGRNAEKI